MQIPRMRECAGGRDGRHSRPDMRAPPVSLRWRCALAAVLLCVPALASVAPPDNRIPLAIVGDSDSHGYHDERAFPHGSADRGGRLRDTTYQWTEALVALRGDVLDLGVREATGTWGRMARWLRSVGVDVRAPRKVDHRYNFAVSGQGCDDLMDGPSRQVPQLIRLMNEDPARWRRGVVVIRIGVNTFGKAAELDRLARDPRDPAVVRAIDTCVAQIRSAVDAIATAHAGTRIVIVGIFDNRHWAAYLGRWQAPAEQANISAGLDRFDQALQRFAADRPRVAFFDDRAWFASLWGGRDANGVPAYRTVSFGPLKVSNSSGDEPFHATLADGHAGTVWNVLWARALIDLLNQRFGLGVAPLTDAEMVSLLSRRFMP